MAFSENKELMRSYSHSQQSILQTSIPEIPLEKGLKRYMSANMFEGAGNGYHFVPDYYVLAEDPFS